MKKLAFFIISVLSINYAQAGVITGKVTDEESNPLPFASVYVKNSVLGVTTNSKGVYFIELKKGTYTLVISYIGYEKKEITVNVTDNSYKKTDIVLKKSDSVLQEIEVISNRENRANEILRKVRKNRKKYLKAVSSYECDLYVKTSIEKEYLKKDTVVVGDEKNITEYFKKENRNLIEYIAKAYYKKPNKYLEKIIAYHDYSEKKPPGASITMRAGIDDGEIAPRQFTVENPYIFKIDNSVIAINFYNNFIKLPRVVNQPIESPISATSSVVYDYEYKEYFIENGKKIYKINVKPINKHDALFYGDIYIEDSLWSLVSVDLAINERALMMHQNVKIIQNYNKVDSVFLPEMLNVYYTIKDSKTKIYGDTKHKYSNFKIDVDFEKDLSNEVKIFEKDAFEKDSDYWNKNRPVALKMKESDFISKVDSIKEYYKSDEFLDKQDSVFNRITWWTPLIGIGRKNHYIGYEFFIGGILQQVVPFGVGGYRHRLPVYFNKEIKNGMLLETQEQIDYGFLNNDLKWKLGIGLTYYPKKFVRTYIDIGNSYDLINNFASIEQTFSRSNYVNTKFLKIRQRIEILNGLYSELTLHYSNQIPITDIELAAWSDYLFGDLNTPVTFEEYTKVEIMLKLKYRINQKYYFKRNKKVIIGKDYPEVYFTYRKGIPNIFNSEVDFDYVEIGTNAEIKPRRFGTMRWQASSGYFINKKNLRLIEYKYFRGSDTYFFSDPLKSFQLLGPTLNTNYEYLQANFIHHFDGYLLNKVPLINYLKLTVSGGAGMMSIPKADFYHFEMFAGLERIVRIKKQLFRFGVYAVTADNTLSNPDISIKIGFSFFNSFTNKWTY